MGPEQGIRVQGSNAKAAHDLGGGSRAGSVTQVEMGWHRLSVTLGGMNWADLDQADRWSRSWKSAGRQRESGGLTVNYTVVTVRNCHSLC